MEKRRRRNENALPTMRVELRNPKDLNAKGESALRYVVRLKGEGKIVRATGLTIKPELWDTKKQRALGNNTECNLINRIISNKKADFETYFLKLSALDKRISMRLVGEYFYDKRFDSLFGYFDAMLKERAKLNEKSTTIKDNVCRRRFEEFALKKGYKQLKFIDVNLALLKEFDKYLIRTCGIQMNSADNYHKVLKVLFNNAVIDEIIDRSPYLGFEPMETAVGKPKDTLTLGDVEAIRELDLNSPELKHLDKTRKLFLFMLNTGLRFSDVANARLENLRFVKLEDRSVPFIDILQKKTKNPVDVCLNREAMDCLHFFRQRIDKDEPLLFGKMTLQPNNRNLKIIAELAGLKKKLSTHVARHSYATFLFNELEVPLEQVMGGLGHKKVTMTEHYIRNNNLKLVDKLDSLFVAKKVA